MPSLSEAARMSAAGTHTDSKEYESLAGTSDGRDVLQVPTIFSKYVIKSIFMFQLSKHYPMENRWCVFVSVYFSSG